jgi:hypothetical protein
VELTTSVRLERYFGRLGSRRLAVVTECRLSSSGPPHIRHVQPATEIVPGSEPDSAMWLLLLSLCTPRLVVAIKLLTSITLDLCVGGAIDNADGCACLPRPVLVR